MQGMNRWLALAVFVLLCFGVAGVESWMTRPEIGGWYAGIRKPSWNPPNWIFGPVWTALYAMMAVAGWLVWQLEPGIIRTRALWLFAVQLALNFVWSPVFFNWHRPDWAAGVISLLWLSIGSFIVAAWAVSKWATWLFVPYWLWVSFAAALNFTIWKLNPNAHLIRA